MMVQANEPANALAKILKSTFKKEMQSEVFFYLFFKAMLLKPQCISLIESVISPGFKGWSVSFTRLGRHVWHFQFVKKTYHVSLSAGDLEVYSSQ